MVDLKITLKKVLIQTVIVIAAGLASVYGNNSLYLVLVPAINGGINIVKNWDN